MKSWLAQSISHLTELIEDESTIHELFEAAASDLMRDLQL